MDDKNYSLLERVVDKIFSGSFSVLIMIAINICFFNLLCLYLVAKGKLEPKYIEIIFPATIGLLTMMWKDYIHAKSEDKIKINGDGNKVEPLPQPTTEVKKDA